ncbi:MAG: hypothetical protein J7527_06625, partial [Chitinophagaceae bacterium]|nr:hypothetical protein [Chitinophagaceae bacterium]
MPEVLMHVHAEESSILRGPGLGKNGVKKMEGWRRLSHAAGVRRRQKLFEPARQSIINTLPASSFGAGDTLPFLAIFSKALIFFCYFFCIKAKKVKG